MLAYGWSSSTGVAGGGAGEINIGGTAANQGVIGYSTVGDLYIDNTYDNAGGDIFFRLKTAGTPLNALTIDGALGDVDIAASLTVATTTTSARISASDSDGAQLIASGWSSSTGVAHGTAGEINVGGVAATHGVFGYSTVGDLYIDNTYDNAAGEIFIRTKTDGTPVNAITISADGDVGLGDTTPSYMLDVAGDGRFTSTATAANFVASSASATSTFAGGLAIATSGFVYDYSSGNVGIGTASPLGLLNLSSTNPKLYLSDSNAGTDEKHWFLNSSSGAFSIGTTSDSGASDSTYFTIAKDTGVVTVNDLHATNSSGAQLQVSGWSSSFGTSAVVGEIRIGNNATNHAKFDYNYTDLLIENTRDDVSSDIIFKTRTSGTPLTALTLTGSGNVEIPNTLTAASKAIISDTTQEQLRVSGWADGSAHTQSGEIRLGNSTTIGGKLIYNTTDLIFENMRDGDTFDIIFKTKTVGTPVTAMTITGAGEVGIGAIAPAEHFEVEDGDATTGIQISNTATDGDPLLAFALSGTKKFTLGVDDGDSDKFKIGTTAIGTNTRLTIDTSGYVGIGDTSPLSILTVGDGDLFQVNSSGAIVASTGIITSGAYTQSGTSANTFTGTPTFSNATYSALFTGGNVGIGTTTPYATLSVAGNTVLDSNVITYATSSASTLTFRYGAAATSTIQDSQLYAWTIATSTTGTPIIAIDTSGSGNTGQATTTINGGLIVDGGAITHDYSSGVTSIDNLEMGTLNFDTNAGVTVWADLPVTSAAAIGTVERYSAQIDGQAILSIYAESNGTGGIQHKRVSIGTTTPYADLTLWAATTSPSAKVFEVASIASSTLFAIQADGNVGVGTSSPYSKLSVAGNGVFDGLVRTSSFVATSTTATSTFAGGLDIDSGGLVYDFSSNDVWIDSTSTFFVDSSTNRVGIGTTSPYRTLSVSGDTVLDSMLITFGSTTASTLTVDYATTATSTIKDSQIYSWTLATSTTATPIIAIDTSGSGDTGKATTTINGGLIINNGAISYDYGANKTSIERLDLGATTFEDDAGTVSWIDLGVTSSAPAGTAESYTAQIDNNSILSIYAQSDGAGGITDVRTIIGTSTDAILGSSNIPYGSLMVADGALCVDDSQGANCDDSALTRGQIYSESASVTAIDLAENYPTKDSGLEAGDVVMFDAENEVFVTKYDKTASTTASAKKFVGVISTTPGVLLGGFGNELYPDETKVPVTLSGRVPVKINIEGGDIAIGDRLTASSVAGIATKATTSTHTLGVALESFTASSTSDTILTFIDLSYSFADEQFMIDANGNIGVGTTSPEYKIHVIGDVAATSFVNISTEASKKDIEHVTDEEQESMLERLEDVEVAQYRYKHEDEDAPLRLGLIAEEAPTDVLSASGKGVDIYQLATFTLAGVQELSEKVGSLELKIADIEAQVAAINTSGGGASIQAVIDYFVSVGVSFVDGVTHIASLVTGEFKTDKLCVGDTCVTESELSQLLANANISPVVATSTPATAGGTATSTPDGSDTQAPTITIQGNNPANINIGATYSDLGATVTDNVNENLGIKTYLDGTLVTQVTLDTASSTTYTIEYNAIDQAGNSATSTRQVIVGSGDEGLSLGNEVDEGESLVETDTTATTTPETTEDPIVVVEETTATTTPETVNSTSTPQT